MTRSHQLLHERKNRERNHGNATTWFTLGVNLAPESPAGVLLIRHGLTQWNADQRWQGWADTPLSDVGRRQASVAAGTLASMFTGESHVRIVSSDLDRAYATARTFADALGVVSVERIEALRERHVGEWSGLTAHEITKRWPGVLERWRKGEQVPLPGGENEGGFRERILGALRAQGERAATTGVPTIVVSHGGAIRTIETMLHIDARHIANVGGRWFHWTNGDLRPGQEVDLLHAHPNPAATGHSDERSANAAL